MHDKYDTLQKELRLYGLQNGSSIGRHMGLMDEAADAIEHMNNSNPILAEFEFLTGYVAESCFDEEICRDRLRMLWTAFCLHHDLDADTHVYDCYLMELWKRLQETGDGTSEWADFDDFERFMCRYLV